VSPPTRRRALAGGLAVGSAAVLGVLTTRGAAAQSPREIEIVAQRFKFTPNDIALKANERVVLLIRSLDFAHGFNLPDLGMRADLLPGRITRLELQAPKPGKLEFVCDNFCGSEHEEMHGQFTVSA
jgi:cytochrome c oxidase subunit II